MAHCIMQEVAEGRGFPDGTVVFDTTVVPPHRLENHVEKLSGCDPRGSSPRAKRPGCARQHTATWAASASTAMHGPACPGCSPPAQRRGRRAWRQPPRRQRRERRVRVRRHRRAIGCREAGSARAARPGPDPHERRRRTRSRTRATRGCQARRIERARDPARMRRPVPQRRRPARSGLERLDALARDCIHGLQTADRKETVRALEARNMIAVARFIMDSALLRREVAVHINAPTFRRPTSNGAARPDPDLYWGGRLRLSRSGDTSDTMGA